MSEVKQTKAYGSWVNSLTSFYNGIQLDYYSPRRSQNHHTL